MIELTTDCVSCCPTSDAARLMGEWQLTMSSWRQHAFTNRTALWKAACAGCFLGQRLALQSFPLAPDSRGHAILFLQVYSDMTGGFPVNGGPPILAWGRK